MKPSVFQIRKNKYQLNLLANTGKTLKSPIGFLSK